MKTLHSGFPAPRTTVGYAPQGGSIDPTEAIRRFRAGHEAAAHRQRELERSTGARPEQAVREAQDALQAMIEMGLFPCPRDAVSQRGIDLVRARWARIQSHARAARES